MFITDYVVQLSCLFASFQRVICQDLPSTSGASSQVCPFTNTLAWTAASKFCKENKQKSASFVILRLDRATNQKTKNWTGLKCLWSKFGRTSLERPETSGERTLQTWHSWSSLFTRSGPKYLWTDLSDSSVPVDRYRRLRFLYSDFYFTRFLYK